MKLLQAVFVLVLGVECLQAQVNQPLYVVDGEFDGGQNSTLYRIDPGSGVVLETIGDTGEHLIAIAVDPETGDIIGLTAPDSANADSLVRIDPDSTQVSGIVALVPPDGEEMPEFLDMFQVGAEPWATAVSPQGSGFPFHYKLDPESGQIDRLYSLGTLIPGRLTGIAADQSAVAAPTSMVMFGCNDTTGESGLHSYMILATSAVPDPQPPPVIFALPDQNCVTAGTRADGHTFYGVGVPFGEGASRTLLRIDLAGDGSAAVETLGPLPDDAAGIAFGPIPQPSPVPALGGTGRTLLIALLLLSALIVMRAAAWRNRNTREF